MKIRIITIKDDGFDLRKEMKKYGYTVRSLSQKTGIHFTHINNICNGLIINEDKAKIIRKHLTIK